MGSKISRRQVLKTGLAAIAVNAMPQSSSAATVISKVRKVEKQSLKRLSDYALTHGGIQQVHHDRLGVEVTGQTCIRYLRFGRQVTIDHLLLHKHVYGRSIPEVPVHPAHLIISRFDDNTQQWQTLQEVDLPADSRISGDGLSQSMSIEEMDAHFARVLADPPFKIDLGKIKTDHLRIICDREHPVWPSHGEFNGGTHNVPFGILNKLAAVGLVGDEPAFAIGYQPVLRKKQIMPQAPSGMRVSDLPDMLLYESKYLSIGFSLHRPLLMNLKWSVTGKAATANNRLYAKRFAQVNKLIGGPSGPIIRTLQADYPAFLFTGEVSVEGNRVCYRNLRVIDGLSLDAVFTVAEDHFTLELTQTCNADIPVLEAEAWRFVWDLTQGITGCAGVPTLKSGRNGDVTLPAMWAGDDDGCLSCELLHGAASESRLQVESYRARNCVTGGLILGKHPGAINSQVIPLGTMRAQFRFSVSNFEPKEAQSAATPSEALKRHWATVFSCYRPEYRGFSNHSASVNCHLSQGPPIEIAALTKRPANGQNPLDLARYTVSRALLDGGGYGYCRNLYLDSDPILLSAVGRIHQTEPDTIWLKKIEPGVVDTVNRMLNLIGDQGLIVCRDLSGNSGSYRWSTNAMDIVGFGHIDGYVNAWAYRAFRNAAAMLDDLANRKALSRQCRQAAERIRSNFSLQLLNPETGWIAGWRSRDGMLHDYAFLWVNGVALAFGLLDDAKAKQALQALEELRYKVGPDSARLGLPCNLLPIREPDHMLAKISDSHQPTFETYTDGSLSGWPATYYLRGLSIYGLKKAARKMAEELQEGYAAGVFNGGDGTGHEFRSWEGLPTGYEGTLIGCFGPLYAIAIETGVAAPLNPEWWPANG